jgi:hypothetical protein
MKTSNIAAWFFLLIVLGIASCGGTETVVSSSSDNTQASNEQVNDNTDPIRLFDGPTDPNDPGH